MIQQNNNAHNSKLAEISANWAIILTNIFNPRLFLNSASFRDSLRQNFNITENLCLAWKFK